MTSLSLLFFGLCATFVQDTAPPPLGLQAALEEAYALNPKLQGALALADQAYAQAEQSRAPLLPQVSGQAGYLRSTSNFAGSPGTVPSALSAATTQHSLARSQNFFTFGLTLNQLVWDFGATYYTTQASFLQARAQMLTARDQMAQTALLVRTAFFAAQASRANLGVAEENAANQEKHRAQISGQVAAGGRPEIDLLQAKTDTSNARVQLIQANANYRLAKAQLNSVIGREGDITYDIVEEKMPASSAEDWPFAQALREALSARPDFLAATLQVESQKAQLKSARATFLPALSVSGSLNDAGGRLANLAPNWRAGGTLNWPLFGGGQSYFQVATTRASLRSLEATAAQIRQAVRLNLCQARLNLESATEQVVAANDAKENARSLLRQAEARYAAGVSSVIELGDAQFARTQSETQAVGAHYALSTARATYLRALGRA